MTINSSLLLMSRHTSIFQHSVQDVIITHVLCDLAATKRELARLHSSRRSRSACRDDHLGRTYFLSCSYNALELANLDIMIYH